MNKKIINALIVGIFVLGSLVYPATVIQVESGDTQVVEEGVGSAISNLFHKFMDLMRRILDRIPILGFAREAGKESITAAEEIPGDVKGAIVHPAHATEAAEAMDTFFSIIIPKQIKEALLDPLLAALSGTIDRAKIPEYVHKASEILGTYSTMSAEERDQWLSDFDDALSLRNPSITQVIHLIRTGLTSIPALERAWGTINHFLDLLPGKNPVEAALKIWDKALSLKDKIHLPGL
jgi:hypothetical protein